MTPEEDAEDLATLLRETRTMQGISAWELAQRAGVSTEDVLAFEAARIIPADERFAVYMRCLGYES